MGYEDLFNIAVAKNPPKYNCTELSKNEVFCTQETKSQLFLDLQNGLFKEKGVSDVLVVRG